MLFDIRGRRKRFIQVIYVFLALLLGGSLVLFGIGGDAPGGLGDALGIGQNSNTGGSTEFDEEIEQAETTLASDPDNAQALLALARYNYLNAQQSLEVDEEQGTQALTEEAVAGFEASTDAWERYLEVNQGKADPGTASLVFRAYSNIALDSTNATVIQRRLEGAQEAAAVVAEQRAGPATYFELARAAYFAGDVEAGKEAGVQALEEVDESGRASLESQLNSAKRQGKVLQRQLKDLESDPSATGPLGELGGGGGLAPPAEDSATGE